LVKARDGYGLVFERVKRNNQLKQLESTENRENNLPNGTIPGKIVLFNDTILDSH